MTRRFLLRLITLVLACGWSFAATGNPLYGGFQGGRPMVELTTNHGVITVELDAQKAPISVQNFLQYVKDGHYDGTIFHRVIPGFMLQTGGMLPDMSEKATRPAIKNEADNGLRNDRGTLAMARTQATHSATSQFFINVSNNDFLNHGGRDFGYAVFGRVVKGMEVVDAIASVATGNAGFHQNVPVEPVIVQKAQQVQ